MSKEHRSRNSYLVVAKGTGEGTDGHGDHARTQKTENRKSNQVNAMSNEAPVRTATHATQCTSKRRKGKDGKTVCFAGFRFFLFQVGRLRVHAVGYTEEAVALAVRPIPPKKCELGQ